MIALDLADRLQPVLLCLFRDELDVEEGALVGAECVVSRRRPADDARADVGDDIFVETVRFGDDKTPTVFERTAA
jgi:hypothetical protein